MGLRAQVRTRDGWAVQHAIVTVTDMTGTQILRATADEDGATRTEEPLPAGAYTVIVTAVGYAPAASTALVTAGGRIEAGTVVLARQGGVELPRPATGRSTPRTARWPPPPSIWASPACAAGSPSSAAGS